jgi:hypothetical protein
LQHHFHRPLVARGDEMTIAEFPFPLGGFRGQDVAPVRGSAFYFAGSGEPEPLFRATSRFALGHRPFFLLLVFLPLSFCGPEQG